ncbi:hypothetical protein BGZ89_003362, partial [Linnemannia elongata]
MSDQPLDQWDPHTTPGDSASSTVRIRKRGKLREFWGLFNSNSKEVKLKASNPSQHTRPSFQQSSRPSSALLQASILSSGDNHSNFPSTSPSGDDQSTPFNRAQEESLLAPFNEAH